MSNEMAFSEHIEELKARLKVVVYCLLMSSIAMMVLPANIDFIKDPLGFYEPLIGLILRNIRSYILESSFLFHSLNSTRIELIAVEITAPLELYVLTSILFGVIVSMPVIAYEAYKFIDPALYPHERKMIYPFITSFTILFIVGGLFGFFILCPFLIWAMLPFYYIVGAQAFISVIDFYNVIFFTVLMTGLSFTIPVIFVILVKLGFIDTTIVTKRRRYIYAVLFILTAIITPNGGPLADLALFIPMIILLEVAVLVAKKYEGIRERRFTLLPSVKYVKCSYCGAEIPEGSVFCTRCGRATK
ncbi:MAG: twin-arginine translocase subunit TatC [Candidatus Methanomethylicia archaeon]